MTRQRVIITVGAWVVVVASLWASSSQPAVLAIGGIVVAGTAIVFIAGDIARTTTPVEWSRNAQPSPTPAAEDARVNRLRHQVQAAWLTGSTRVNDTLVDLVDDRLLAHHHIDRATDPELADRFLSPTLRRLVSGPRRQTATPRELQRILTDIEAL